MKNYKLKMMTILLALTGCSNQSSTTETAASTAAEAFAEAYFNYDLQQAKSLITPESEKWLRFAASSITQRDIDSLNARQDGGATARATDAIRADDSTVIVTVEVANFMHKDSIGSGMKLTAKSQFLLTVVSRNGQNYVRMEGLPRSEKQSHDSGGDE